MKRQSQIIVCLVLCLTSFSASVLAQQFTSNNDRFTIWMPAKPVLDNKTLNTELGRVNMRTFTVATPNGAFIVAVNQYPIATDDPAAIKLRIDSGRDNLIKGAKGKLLSEKNISLNGFPGREIKVSSAAGFYKMQIFLVKYSLYQVGAFGTKSFTESVTAGKFFNSFKFLDENIGEKWTTFSSTENGFSVLFPTKPRVTTKIIATEKTRKLNQSIFSVASMEDEYSVIVTDIAGSLLLLDEATIIERFFEVAEGGDIKILSQEDILFDNHTGIEARAVVAGKPSRMRIFVRGGKFYQVFYSATEEKLKSRNAERFFDSFKFTKPVKPALPKGRIVGKF